MTTHIEAAPRPSFLSHVSYYIRFGLVLTWGLLVTSLFLPVAVLLWGNTSLSWAYARTLAWGALKLLGIKVEVEGREHLKTRPGIFLGNHQSNFDILFHGSVYPRHTVVIGKRELLKVPLFGLFFAATGNILIDRRDRSQAVAGLADAVSTLQQRSTNIWIFPEGTRSKGTGLGEFKKGGFHMAAAARAPIIPVVCAPVDAVLDVAGKTVHGGTLRIKVLPPISTLGVTEADLDGLRADVERKFRQTLATLS
jgi:1-acyl-sn-glycerol-3-phosphate acyltransferase